MRVRIRTTSPPSVLLAVALLAAGCASGDPTRPTPGSAASAAPHGYVEGATEAAEQQSRLLLGDPRTGETRVLDLTTGRTHGTARRTGVTGLTTDGRFGYFHGPQGTHVLDGGTWTVDHGDHVHYYRATIRDVGELPGGPGTHIRGDSGTTVVTGPGGQASVYRRADLEQGTIGRSVGLPGTYAGPVVPDGERLIALTRDGGGPARAVVLDRDGKRVAVTHGTCEDPRGDAVTRRGVVFGCADGALLVTDTDGGYTAERIPYGDDVPEDERATAFRHRPGGTVLTAPAGKNAVWVLEVTGRAWTRVGTGPVVAANTAGEGAPLLVLQADGALHGYDIATGKETAVTAPLLNRLPQAPAGRNPAPVIEVDRSRAYLNDPQGKRVYEIDYNDGLRVARTLELDIRPSLMAETGR
ncbi:hypothetical protein HHX38_13185 [Streptomyces sp. PKU-MA01144]|uniref:hypothetical protein n=1 Tax=Streptomyces sp. PKU-MA01144 TaxID=2729138 RepID=UPI00147CCF5A|nr:hypothetical protein [Streptomyces sp. PKU-MA01144]NNJ05082.1 hypothetical protein [Streptomyces sp. PKU-MA01144]